MRKKCQATGKSCFASRKEARKAKRGFQFFAYRCEVCQMVHIANVRWRRNPKLREVARKNAAIERVRRILTEVRDQGLAKHGEPKP